MSRIGKLPISLPNGVTAEIKDNVISVKGPKGELKRTLHGNMKIEIADNIIKVTPIEENEKSAALHGLTRTLIANMVEGVSKGYEKQLEIIGVGYRAQTSGNKITLTLGFSHPIEFTAANGIQFEMDKENKNLLHVRGIDKEEVGETAAKIRSFKKPEPYKGKGIKYAGEHIIRKSGKAAATGAGATGAK